jgi:hypothetical protein
MTISAGMVLAATRAVFSIPGSMARLCLGRGAGRRFASAARLTALPLAAFLASCAPEPPLAESGTKPSGTSASICKFGPSGQPLRAADRGIGGTGAPARNLRADRGIGGTGIVGVVTGFASICVNGMEIAFDGSVPIEIDGEAAGGDVLRVGQLVVIEAGGDAGSLRASSIRIRHEVTGPVEAREIGSDAWLVAGQRVTVPRDAWGGRQFGLGDWVRVSGLRGADQTIIATRVDVIRGVTQQQNLMVRGQVSSVGQALRIGSLTLSVPPEARVSPGQFVSVSGNYADGVLGVRKLAADPLAGSPEKYFGKAVSHVVIQSIVSVDAGRILLGGRSPVPVAQGVVSVSAKPTAAVVSLERRPDGSLAATSVRDVPRRPGPANVMPAAAGSGAARTMESLSPNGAQGKGSDRGGTITGDAIGQPPGGGAAGEQVPGGQVPATGVTAPQPATTVSPPVGTTPSVSPVSSPVSSNPGTPTSIPTAEPSIPIASTSGPGTGMSPVGSSGAGGVAAIPQSTGALSSGGTSGGGVLTGAVTPVPMTSSIGVVTSAGVTSSVVTSTGEGRTSSGEGRPSFGGGIITAVPAVVTGSTAVQTGVAVSSSSSGQGRGGSAVSTAVVTTGGAIIRVPSINVGKSGSSGSGK